MRRHTISVIYAFAALACGLLFTTASPISPARFQRRSPSVITDGRRLSRRELIISMLDGSPVDSYFVNLLDQWSIAEDGVKNTPQGTELYGELVQFMEEKATELTGLIDGVAIIQSVISSQPASTSTAEPTEPTSTSSSEPEITDIPESESAIPTSSPAPSSSSEVPIVTGDPQEDTDTVASIPQDNTDAITTSQESAKSTLTKSSPTSTPVPIPVPPSSSTTGGNDPDRSEPSSAPTPRTVTLVVTMTSAPTRTGQAEAAQVSNDIPGSGNVELPSVIVASMGVVLVWSQFLV